MTISIISVLVVSVMVGLGSPALADGFASFTEETNRITTAIDCPDPRVMPPGDGMGALYGCVAGPAQTAKVFVNGIPGTDSVENVKVM